MPSNLVLCDVGNSRIKIALAENETSIHQIAVYPTVEAEKAGIKISEMAGNYPIVLCSVVAKATEVIKAKLDHPILEIESGAQREIANLYTGFGVDRLADIVAAKYLYAKGRSFLVVGLGTATVLTAISSNAEFLGGFITLGMVSTLDSIKVKIPALPNVTLNDSGTKLGTNTLESIGNGALLAQAGCIDRWIEEAKKCLDDTTITIATGGCLDFVVKHTRFVDYCDPMLTLKGIYILGKQKLI